MMALCKRWFKRVLGNPGTRHFTLEIPDMATYHPLNHVLWVVFRTCSGETKLGIRGKGRYGRCHGRLRYGTPGMAGASWHGAIVVRTQASSPAELAALQYNCVLLTGLGECKRVPVRLTSTTFSALPISRVRTARRIPDHFTRENCRKKCSLRVPCHPTPASLAQKCNAQTRIGAISLLPDNVVS